MDGPAKPLGRPLVQFRALERLPFNSLKSDWAESGPSQQQYASDCRQSGAAALGQFGRIGPAVSALIQQYQELQTLLDALGAEWRFDSLIHGDMGRKVIRLRSTHPGTAAPSK
jgi:hypothetical protein